jgi:hypothetical protein
LSAEIDEVILKVMVRTLELKITVQIQKAKVVDANFVVEAKGCTLGSHVHIIDSVQVVLCVLFHSVDAGFDDHDIPMDVIWLDIEHTDGKRYRLLYFSRL